MGELARQRRARDLWVSRGHLWALGVGVVLLVLCSFFLGLTLARGSSTATAAPVADEGAQESLVELLARVDARVVAQDGVDTLTFPDTLTGVADDPELPAPVTPSAPSATISAGAVAPTVADLVVDVEDVSSAERLASLLQDRGWVAVVRVPTDGDDHQVVVQGGADLDEARERRAALLEDLTSLDEARPVAIERRTP